MDVIKLYQEYNIDFSTEGHKHCRPGWVNRPCPFCTGNPGLHLGYNTESNKYVCWRCGGHHTDKVIAKLLGIHWKEAKDIIKKYGGRTRIKRGPALQIKTKIHKYPTGVMPLGDNHRKYLLSRNFDPDHLVDKWGIQGTGPISVLDKIDYKHRIIAPINWNGKQVSFQTRDITGRSPKKYLVCPEDREEIKHKHILYGNQAHWGNVGICVEGITDVWRFGYSSFATFGIKFTTKQIRVIANNFKAIAIIFDNESMAQHQAQVLKHELEFRGTKAWIIKVNTDPGNMIQEEADKLVHTIINTY